MRISILAAAGVAVLALGACSQPAEKAEASEAATEAAVPATGQMPEAFVRSLYLTEQGGTAVRSENPTAAPPSIWSARTAALIDETEALATEGEYGYFEADPICDCQDDGGMVLTGVTTGAVEGDRAEVAVAMTWTGTDGEAGETRRQTYKLVRENGAWKIDDIVRPAVDGYPSMPLVESITLWIAETRAGKAQ